MFYRPAKLMICVAVNLKKNQVADNSQFDSDSISTTVFETDRTPARPFDQRIVFAVCVGPALWSSDLRPLEAN
jgi:hypothetical protein